MVVRLKSVALIRRNRCGQVTCAQRTMWARYRLGNVPSLGPQACDHAPSNFGKLASRGSGRWDRDVDLCRAGLDIAVELRIFQTPDVRILQRSAVPGIFQARRKLAIGRHRGFDRSLIPKAVILSTRTDREQKDEPKRRGPSNEPHRETTSLSKFH